MIRLLALLCLVATGTASATQAPDQPLIDIDGQSITRAALDLEMANLADSTAIDASDPAARTEALDRLVERRLLSRAGVEQFPEMGADVRYLATARAVWDELRHGFHSHPDLEALDAFRERRIQKVTVRQIISATPEGADDVLKRLADGADFSELAKAVSVDVGSAAAGGKVYPIRYGEWLPQLVEACESIDETDVVGPVRTRLGWHVLICDRLEYDEQTKSLVSDDLLTDKMHTYDELVGIEAWANQLEAETGARVVDEALDDVVSNLLPVPARTRPPATRRGWSPSDAVLVESNGDVRLTVAEFVRLYPVLGWLEFPRPRNRESIRTTALRVAFLDARLDEVLEGKRSLSPRFRSQADAERDLALGSSYLESILVGIDPTAEEAEEIYALREDAFMTPESVGLAALYTEDLAVADELFAKLEADEMTFDEAYAEAKVRDPEASYVPHMPSFSKGAFPETDQMVFSLEEGEYAAPYPTRDGYMIFKLLKKRPARKLRRVEMDDDMFMGRVRDVLAFERKTETLDELKRRFSIRRHDQEVRDAIDAK